MKVLKELLKNNSLETFLDKHFTKLPFSIPNEALPFIHLLNWKVLEDILKENKSVLRIVQDGRVIKDYVELSYEEAKKYHSKGHTLLLRYAEKSNLALKDLADDFSKSFKTEVDIQLYCTPQGHNAFGWHYDVEEVFILQTEGSKQYTIRPNTIHPNPLITSIPKDLGYEKEKTPIEIKVLLKKGDWLYIPSGWWHRAITKEESMHISIGLMPRTAIDLVSELPQYLSSLPFWRTRMPLHIDFKSDEEAMAFYQNALDHLAKDLEGHLKNPNFLNYFLAKKKRDFLNRGLT